MKNITLDIIKSVLTQVVPSKYPFIMDRLPMYGNINSKKELKGGLFYVNEIFKLGNNKDYINPLYQYRLTTAEINTIVHLCVDKSTYPPIQEVAKRITLIIAQYKEQISNLAEAMNNHEHRCPDNADYARLQTKINCYKHFVNQMNGLIDCK